MFSQRSVVYTEPTELGNKNISLYSTNYCVKRLAGRKISSFSDNLWLRLLDCEKKGIIKVTIKLPGGKKPDVLKSLKKRYLVVDLNETDSIKKKALSKWNILRAEVLRIVLKRLKPIMVKNLRKTLTKFAYDSIKKKCYLKFKQMLLTPPYKAKRSGRIIVICSEPKSEGKVTIIALSNKGIL